MFLDNQLRYLIEQEEKFGICDINKTNGRDVKVYMQKDNEALFCD